MIYTKEKFKELREANEYGSDITFNDIIECAVAWGISCDPRTRPLDEITYKVLKAAQVNDAEKYNPNPTPHSEGRIMIDLDKACEWIDNELPKYIMEGREGKPYISVALIDEFKKAMKNESN